jgi:hypothetical protein
MSALLASLLDIGLWHGVLEAFRTHSLQVGLKRLRVAVNGDLEGMLRGFRLAVLLWVARRAWNLWQRRRAARATARY